MAEEWLPTSIEVLENDSGANSSSRVEQVRREVELLIVTLLRDFENLIFNSLSREERS